jgi:hypothetical protein
LLFRISSCQVIIAPIAVKRKKTDKPLTTISLYLSKNGTKKKIARIISMAGKKKPRTFISICNCHCNTIPTINGTNNLRKGAFFHIYTTGIDMMRR